MALNETDALLGQEDLLPFKKKQSLTKKLAFYFPTFLAILLIAFITIDKVGNNDEDSLDVHSKKNVIFMVTDGMGPASLSLARSFKQYKDDLPFDSHLTLDDYLIGSSRTRSNSSLITDLAAGATAFSCGLKSYNGAIGVDYLKSPCGTILESLKLQGYLTGLVVTTRITDATPAAFSSHVDYRFQEDLIAQHQLGENPLGRMVDLIIGGGKCHFLPSSKGGCRVDSRDLIEEFKNTWAFVDDRHSFDDLNGGHNVTLPLLGLLADTDIPYDIDRDSEIYPSLDEQVKVALTALSKATKKSDKGFFLLIEGSRIDHAGHHNDPAAQVREVLAYDKAFKQVIDFVNSSDVETVVISTSDHETGGLVTARQTSPDYPDYLWYPEVLLNAKHSGEYLAPRIYKFFQKSTTETQEQSKFVYQVLKHELGFSDIQEEEVKRVIENAHNLNDLLYTLNDLVSFRSQTGWTTHGHSAVDVNIYAHTNSKSIRKFLHSKHGLNGNRENIEMGTFMEAITGSNLSKVSKLIKDIQHSPTVKESDFTQQDLESLY